MSMIKEIIYKECNTSDEIDGQLGLDVAHNLIPVNKVDTVR